jgi:hypothetical protein
MQSACSRSTHASFSSATAGGSQSGAGTGADVTPAKTAGISRASSSCEEGEDAESQDEDASAAQGSILGLMGGALMAVASAAPLKTAAAAVGRVMHHSQGGAEPAAAVTDSDEATAAAAAARREASQHSKRRQAAFAPASRRRAAAAAGGSSDAASDADSEIDLAEEQHVPTLRT